MTDLISLLDVKQLSLLETVPRQTRLYEALKNAILQGRLLAGAVLPASRLLARDLGMARNSVIHAYEQLAAEGYVQADRQGTVVARLGAPRSSSHGAAPLLALSMRVRASDRQRSPAMDLMPFVPGIPALEEFPVKVWRRLCDRALRQGGADDLCYRAPSGEPELRQAIATYLRAARGVICHADQVVVTDGTQHSLTLCAQMFADVGELAWIEHPGYGGARTAFHQAGLGLVPVTVDIDGLNPPEALWRSHRPRLIYTTPSHQYPLGSVLSLHRRLTLIESARRHGAWILEDDYDSEFRHDGPPLAAMQGLVDHAPVVYLGTFSKSMFPALRLGFIVLPEAIADRALGVVGELARRGAPSQQRALAAFIDEGHFTSHLRAMRRLYAARQQALREALAQHWRWEGAVLGGQCGLHLVVSLPAGLADAQVAARAFESGLCPRPLSAYGTGGIAGFNGLVLGYGRLRQDRANALVKQLADAVMDA